MTKSPYLRKGSIFMAKTGRKYNVTLRPELFYKFVAMHKNIF